MISITTIEKVYNLRMSEMYEKRYSMLEAKDENYISKNNSKMPGRTWDLPAVLTCKGSFNSDGTVENACKKCYASKGTFIYKNVKQVRLNNMLAWKNPDWVKNMIKEIKKTDLYFRFFASGDAYEVELLEKIYEICLECKDTYFWIPTRMFKFSEFRPIIDKLNSLPNVVVRFSSDSITGQKIEGDYTSSIIPKPVDIRETRFICPSYLQGGKCADCRECWSKDRQEVLYPLH